MAALGSSRSIGLGSRFARVSGVALVILASWAVATRAQVIDPGFWMTNGPVNTTLRLGDTLYVGGSFSYVGPRTGAFAAFDSATAELRSGFPRVDGAIFAIAADGNGGWYIGGSFTRIGGIVRNRLAHLRSDGTLDAWDPNPNWNVVAIVARGGLVYVGGNFTQVGGAARTGLAAIDAATGLATAWNPGPNGYPYAIVPAGDFVYVGGTFTTIGGQPRVGLAMLDATTGVAAPWNPGLTGTNPFVRALALGNGVVYAGGRFTGTGGQPRSNLAALDASTGAATAWNPGANGEVRALALNAGAVIAGGYFSTIGGQSRRYLAALDATTGLATAWNPAPDMGVNQVNVSAGAVHVAGTFATIGGQPRMGLAALDPVTGSPLSFGSTISAGSVGVEALAVSHGVVAAGGFTSVGGVRRMSLAAIDLHTGRPTSWDPGADRTVHALSSIGGTIVAGGEFATVGGQAHRAVAQIDGTSGAVLPWDPGLDGASPSVSAILPRDGLLVLGGYFTTVGGQPRTHLAEVDATTGALLPWNPAANGEVRSLAALGGGVVAGGFFTAIGGQARNRLAVIDTASALASGWDPNANNSVLGVAVAPGRVYAAGTFTTVGGTARRYLAALDPATVAALAWNPNPSFTAFTAVPFGASVYAGGAFASIGGKSRMAAAELDSATALATAWDPGQTLYANDAITTIVPTATTVYAGGTPGLLRIVPASSAAPAVSVVTPAGGDVLRLGQSVALGWSASAPDPGVQSVDVRLSRTGASGPWEVLALAAPNTGSYAWAVSGAPAAGTCYLRVDARDWVGHVTSAVGAGAFTIADTAGLAGVGDAPRAASFALGAPAPNPAAGTVVISYDVPRAANVCVRLLDVQGRVVARLANGAHEPGRHVRTLDAGRLRTGLYFLHLAGPGASLTRRLVVAR